MILKSAITAVMISAMAFPVIAESADINQPTDTARWALVTVSVASMRSRDAHSSELISQATMGTPVHILANGSEWTRVETPEGYEGFIPTSSIALKSDQQMSEWADAKRVIVTSFDQINATETPGSDSPRQRVTDLVNGCILESIPSLSDSTYTAILLPDGRQGYVNSTSVSDFQTWMNKPFDVEQLLDYAYAMEGTPYLWGGASSKALDCSGLSKTAYFTQAVILRRDASQQAQTGNIIDAHAWQWLEPGDLLFFGNPETNKVTHVAIYDRDSRYIHSSRLVRHNSIDPENPDYLPYYNFLWATRIADAIGTNGITPVKDHPWYCDPKFFIFSNTTETDNQ